MMGIVWFVVIATGISRGEDTISRWHKGFQEPVVSREVAVMLRKTRKFELSRYEALLMQQGDDDVISSLEALMLAVADEMRRRAATERRAVKRRGGVAR
jgi:hypothetical protein